MQSDPVPLIAQLEHLDKSALLKVKYALQQALSNVLPKRVVARYHLPVGSDGIPYFVESCRTRCGRDTCQLCINKIYHGPYFYLMTYVQSEKGGRRNRKSKYLGKTLPPEYQAMVDQIQQTKALEDPVRVEHSLKVGGTRVGHRAFRKVAQELSHKDPIQRIAGR